MNKLNPLKEELLRDSRQIGKNMNNNLVIQNNQIDVIQTNKTHRRSKSDLDNFNIHVQNNNISIHNNFKYPARNSINVILSECNIDELTINSDDKTPDNNTREYNMVYDTRNSSPVVEIEEENTPL